MLDFGDVVVHVMSEDMRSYYDMESFYGAAEEVSTFLLLHPAFLSREQKHDVITMCFLLHDMLWKF